MQGSPHVSRVMLMQINSFMMRARMIADGVSATGFLSRSLWFLAGSLKPKARVDMTGTCSGPSLEALFACLMALNNCASKISSDSGRVVMFVLSPGSPEEKRVLKCIFERYGHML